MMSVRLSQFFAEEARMSWPDDDHPHRGEYVISDTTLHLVDASIPTDRDGVFLGNVIDTVWDGV